MQVGELGLEIWERVLVRPLASALTGRVVSALCAARDSAVDPALATTLQEAIHSTVQVSQPPSVCVMCKYFFLVSYCTVIVIFILIV